MKSLLLAAALAACAPASRVMTASYDGSWRMCRGSILVATRPAAAAAPELEAAIRYWDAELEARAFLYGGLADGYAGNEIVYVGINDDDLKGKIAGTYAVADGHCMRLKVIALAPRALDLPSVRLETVLRHELGHALGLADSQELGNLMTGDDPDAQHPVDASPEDRALLREIYQRWE